MNDKEAIDILTSTDKDYCVSDYIEAQNTLIESAEKTAKEQAEDYVKNDLENIIFTYMSRKADELINELEANFPEIFYTNISHTPTFTGNNIKEVIREVLK